MAQLAKTASCISLNSAGAAMVNLVPQLFPCCTPHEEEFELAATDALRDLCTEAMPSFADDKEGRTLLSRPGASGDAKGRLAARWGAGATAILEEDGMYLGTGETFTIKVRKSAVETPLGLHLDLADGALVQICDLLEGGGPIKEYNAGAAEELQIRPGDYLVGVNGIRGTPAQLLDLLRECLEPTLEVIRPHKWTVNVTRTPSLQVGLELNYSTEGRSLVVDKVLNGAVKEWNSTNPEMAIQRRDRIVAVNGSAGSPTVLLRMIAACNGELALEISRPKGTTCAQP